MTTLFSKKYVPFPFIKKPLTYETLLTTKQSLQIAIKELKVFRSDHLRFLSYSHK